MSALRDSTPDAAGQPRGFVYFCEQRRQYRRGIRAWIFWAPYLAGAILLEPRVLSGSDTSHPWWSWLPILGYLILFPPLCRTLFRRIQLWRGASSVTRVTRRATASAGVNSD